MEEHFAEFFVVEDFVTRLVVLSDHAFDFRELHVLAKFLHGEQDVFRSDDSRIVRVELLEDRLELRVCEEVSHVDSRSEELTIVNHLIALVVHLRDYVLDLIVTNTQLLLP